MDVDDVARAFVDALDKPDTIGQTIEIGGAEVFDYGNNLRGEAALGGLDRARAFSYPGFVPAFIRPLFCTGKGPFRWVALSGDPEDIYKTDAKVKEILSEDKHLHNWLDMARARISFQGLPARICWVGLGVRHKLGLAFNEMVARGELKAPVVIGRDHLDSGSVASPNRETEAMRDGSDAVSDWPLLNALLNTASGATWVSLHHGGGVPAKRRRTRPPTHATPGAANGSVSAASQPGAGTASSSMKATTSPRATSSPARATREKVRTPQRCVNTSRHDCSIACGGGPSVDARRRCRTAPRGVWPAAQGMTGALPALRRTSTTRKRVAVRLAC